MSSDTYNCPIHGDFEIKCPECEPPTNAVRYAEVPKFDSFEHWYRDYELCEFGGIVQMLRDAFAAGSEVTTNPAKEPKS